MEYIYVGRNENQKIILDYKKIFESKTLDELTKTYQWDNLKLPVDSKKAIAKLPKVAEQSYRHSWIHDTDNRVRVTIDHPFI